MHRLIFYLEEVIGDPKKRDREAMAVLRRGLTTAPGKYEPMFKYILPRLTPEEQEEHFETYCLVAALYANHPSSTNSGNLGNHLRQTVDKNNNSLVIAEATERRFFTLLRAHPEDMPEHLSRILAYIRSKDIQVNWDQLLKDLLLFKQYPDRVRKEWAQGFWGYFKEEAEIELTSATESDSITEE